MGVIELEIVVDEQFILIVVKGSRKMVRSWDKDCLW